ncbi:tetratricopeptide repeat protein [Gemmata sp. JC673]|uniref:Tetratricopeptide repeat protein n=1 Tax=Gemmata algarum TaxID=2975278 RepID=A0ABU5F2I7_9BACT|nr:tetratricopeptide repeat protein [Gemmata algarum]MDY3561798.1 tetratricopeptide repeat protein [Gemmata algarum]
MKFSVATHSLSAELAHRVEAFELALETDPRADFARQLPAVDHPLYLAVLGELVRVDLELAWARGRPKRVAEYTARFPAVLTNPALLAAVAFEEFRQRVRAGEAPRPEEYANKYGVPTSGWADVGVEVQTPRPGSMSAVDAPTDRIVAPQPRDEFRTAEVPQLQRTQDRLGAPPLPNARAQALAEADALSDWQDSVSSLPDVGTDFVGFYLAKELGRGAFGRVYLARQGDLAGRPVALKVARGLGAESNTLAQLQHPNIVPIYSYHSAGPFQAVCMPFLGGTTLAGVVQSLSRRASVPSSGKEIRSTLVGGRFDSSTRTGSVGGSVVYPHEVPAAASSAPPEAAALGAAEGWARLDQFPYVEAVLAIGGQLADGLAHAHRRGILHRDLKPANVLLADDGRPMLLDFNLAEDTKLRGSAERAMMGGTLPYMAPEHLEAFRTGEGTLDPRCDVYGLGVILFELLTGRHPFPLRRGYPRVTVPQMIADRAAAPSVRALNPAVSPGAEAIVRRCLAPNPSDRYQRADDLREDIDRHLANRPLKFAPEPSVRERARKWARRHPRLTSSASVAAVAGVVLTLVVGAAVYSRERTRDVEARGRFADHQAAFRDAQSFLDDQTRSEGRLDERLAKLRGVLDTYGVSDDPFVSDEWRHMAAFRRLSEADRDQVCGNIGEVFFLMAQVALLQASGGDGAERAAQVIRANNWHALAASYGAHRLPRAIGEQRVALLELKGDRAGAERSRAEVESTPLDLARDLYLAGSQLTRNGRHVESLKLLQKATQADPENFSAWFLRGTAHLALEQNDLAAMCFGACVALRPDFAPAWMNRGLAFFRMRHFDSSRDDYDRALKLDPKLAEAYMQRGQLREAAGDSTGAIGDYTQALETGTAPARAYFKRATAKFRAGDRDGAKADREAGFRVTPTDELSWVARAENRWTEDPTAALADADEALKVNGRSVFALQMKAAILSEGLKRPDEALKVLDRAVELHPDYVPARAGRGVLLARAGKREEALRDARDALRRDTHAPNLYQVGCIYALTAKTHPDDKREARKLLWEGLKTGFALDLVDTDTDLDSLRDDQDFKALVADAKALNAPRSEKR